MNIIQYNINGLKNNISDINLLNIDHNPSIICLQETHLTNKSNLAFPNFNLISNHQNSQKATQGVAILIKNNIPHSIINLTTNLQVVAIQTKIPFPVTIATIYIHPELKIDEIDLQNILNQLPTPFLILGDFNGHNPLWGSNSKNKKGVVLENFLNNNRVMCLNNGQTTYLHPGSGSKTAIDLSLCDPSIKFKLNWKVLPQYSSDHNPILISSNLNPHPQATSYSPSKINLKSINWPLFHDALEPIKKPPLTSSVEDLISFLETSISTALTIASSPMSYPKRRTVPWWNKELSVLYKQKSRAYKKFIRNSTPSNLSSYQKIKKDFKNLCISEKRNNWTEFISTINPSTPSATLWNKIRAISGSKPPSSINTIFHQGISISNPVDISNLIGSYFSSHSTDNPTDRLRRAEIESKSVARQGPITEIIHKINEPITYSELITALDKTKNNTAPGPDLIHYATLKKLPFHFKIFLLKIFNIIIQSGTYPSIWKHAIVKPIPKPMSDPFLISGFRPISLINCSAKLLDKIIASRLNYWYFKDNLISPFQFGFRKGLSTVDALSCLQTDLVNNLNKKQHIDCIALDIEKAFDKCWPETIIYQLTKWGLQGNLLKTIKSFLENRHFQVTVNNSKSDTFYSNIGVPQGSPLSVPLFLAAINGITSSLSKTPKISYLLSADDILIYTSSQKNENNNIQLGLQAIENWAKRYGFHLSTQKTKHIHFCRFRNCIKKSYSIHSTPIPSVESLKYLGIIIDSKLNLKEHIEYVKTKCTKKVNVIKLLSGKKWGADRTQLIHISNMLVRSTIEYGSPMLSTAPKSVKSKLTTIYNTCIRAAIGAFRTSPIESIHTEANTTSMSIRLNYISVKHFLNISSNLKHPIYNETLAPIILNKRINHHINEAKLLLLEHQIDISSLKSISEVRIPPWHDPKSMVDISLSANPKQTTSSAILKPSVIKRLNDYKNFNKIYTDGSKTKTSTSLGIFSLDYNIQEGIKLNKNTSIFEAEARAILLASELSPPNHKTLIITDSLSVAKSIAATNTKHETISRIQNEIFSKNLKILWIPSHIGIHGNDKADKLAQDSHNSNDIFNNLSKQDLYRVYSTAVIENLQTIHENNHNSKILEIKPKILTQYFPSMHRRDAVVLTRLRIGHSNLTHSHLLSHAPPPGCPNCQTILTIKHILIECPCFQSQRNRLFQNRSLKELLDPSGNNLKNVFLFLKQLNLYEHI